MLAVDTNVLVRLLVGDDAQQRRAALKRFERVLAAGDAVVVSPVVLAELTWVLGSVRLLAEPCRHGAPSAHRHATVRGARARRRGRSDRALREGRGRFADYLILGLARAEGASALLTFDKRLLKTAGCQLP
ncbi:MAG: PIN domain-containing protein [Polyangiaceae bacterium]|nr:PIN domain-containing protein [Polyangiaceae bacterium]